MLSATSFGKDGTEACDHRGASESCERGCSVAVRMRRRAAMTSASGYGCEHNVPGPADRVAGLNQEGEHETEPGVRPQRRSDQRELVPWPP